MECPKCKIKLEDVFYLRDDRDGLEADGGLEYLLCTGCGQELLPKSGWGMYKPSTKVGWEKKNKKWWRMFLRSEWDAQLARTKTFLKELADKEKAKKKPKRKAARLRAPPAQRSKRSASKTDLLLAEAKEQTILLSKILETMQKIQTQLASS